MSNNDRDFFSGILVNPAKLSDQDMPILEELVKKYPQADILHALLALSSKNAEASVFEQRLQSAAVYSPNRNILYRVINNPESLFRPDRRQNVQAREKENRDLNKSATANIQTEDQKSQANEAKVTDNENVFHLKDEIKSKPEEDVFEEITPIEQISTDSLVIAEPETPKINFLPGVEIAQALNDELAIESKTNELATDTTEVKAVPQLDPQDFLQRRRFRERLSAAADAVNKESVYNKKGSDGAVPVPKPEDERLSKYDDDKMPFTFMWWLNKTRKEHATVYQPYLHSGSVLRRSINVSANNTDELQQQYYEGIFQLKTFEEFEKQNLNPDSQFSAKRKINDIIESFIKKEPQIRPPSGDKIDTENKASKSSEDQDGIISETLARIYSEQMLFHKAISTYQKLMLKYPEKRSYFASQIESLEKKIN